MKIEEFEKKARQEAKNYKTIYSEDFTMSDMLSRPQDVSKQSIKDVYFCLKEKHYRDGFTDGAKWGMEHEWHDLRKDPNDLPKCEEKQQIIFYVKEFNTDIEKDTSHFCLGFFAKSFMNDDLKVFIERSKGYECEHLSQEVIKWCELPQFKDKE